MENIIAYFSNPNGWLGVGLGLAMFAMGYWRGLARGMSMFEAVITGTIDDLSRQGYIRTRRIFNAETGTWEVDLLKYDEE